MAEKFEPAAGPEQPAISAEALKQAEHYIEAEEGATNRLSGMAGTIVMTVAVVMSLFHLYTAIAGAWPFRDFPIIATQPLRYTHVAFVLVLTFLLFPLAARYRDRIRWWDVALGAAGAGILVYAIMGGEDFTDRATLPNNLDIVLGVIFIALLIEATRRTIGWIVPAVALAFIAYALFGDYLPPPWNHRGYDFGQLVGHLFITLEGIFGIPVDVSATLIILFTIYGAFLQHSGAGKFFIDFSMALMGNKTSSAGRTVVLSSFLLGGPSGSGVATTVTVGAVAYPMMQKSGFEKNAAGGLLAAAGLGAIISPPVLGAAAFLIAEFLKISYLDVIWMAVIPTCLYYLSLLFNVELDARRFGVHGETFTQEMSLGRLTARYGFHFASLVSIVVLMVWGYSPTLAVFWSTVLAFGLSFLARETALTPRRLARALADGSTSALTAATTCAIAGIIVGVVTLTGLGLKFSAIVIAYAGGSLLLTALYTALIVWVVGLAVPVTASYIICAVIAAPALMKLGVPDFAAHMFIFYYAVLSEVSPPTALSCFAAAAITGGDPYKTTLQAWKYTLPAFVVPFVFVLDPQGLGLLLKIPKDGSVLDIILITDARVLSDRDFGEEVLDLGAQVTDRASTDPAAASTVSPSAGFAVAGLPDRASTTSPATRAALLTFCENVPRHRILPLDRGGHRRRIVVDACMRGDASRSRRPRCRSISHRENLARKSSSVALAVCTASDFTSEATFGEAAPGSAGAGRPSDRIEWRGDGLPGDVADQFDDGADLLRRLGESLDAVAGRGRLVHGPAHHVGGLRSLAADLAGSSCYFIGCGRRARGAAGRPPDARRSACARARSRRRREQRARGSSATPRRNLHRAQMLDARIGRRRWPVHRGAAPIAGADRRTFLLEMVMPGDVLMRRQPAAAR
ncbi:MAG: TRAP transporter fused permease subunit [Xanthobacteraceae bacterium]|nr:TRAP transporter fused permease subunit [Xanthobacteraceae bacterium]